MIGHFDNVDKKKLKEICGNVLCLFGELPSSLLITVKPQEIADYVKERFDMFGDTGGLIIDGAVEGILAHAKPENADAMMKTVFEYGIYWEC